MGDLTKNFSMDEFLASETAEDLKIKNIPTPQHLEAIKTMLAPWCQDLRDRLGRSIHVMSGYRNPDVNRAVGGVPTSAHAVGLGADLVAAGMTPKSLAKFIAADKDLMARADQIILETSRGVVHVGLARRPRHQILTQPEGPGTPVHPGII